MKISIVIPCYNEEQSIPNLKRELLPVAKELGKKYEIELVFVDDGSKDRTAELLRKEFGSMKNFKLVIHKKNMNLGAAMRTGFGAATGDLVAAFDSDCTFSPRLMFDFLEKMDEGTDIVIASPYHPLGSLENVPFYRHFLSRGISTMYSLVSGSRLYSFTSLARLYRRDVVKKVKFKSDDFLAVSEILIYALLKGYKAKEVPAVLKTRKYGSSKMSTLKEIFNHGFFLVRVFFLRILLFLHLAKL